MVRILEADSIRGILHSRNFVKNTGAELGNTTGYVRYADSPATSPTDGTGGSPSINVTWLATNTSPLRGTYSFKLTKDAVNRQGDGVSFDFTIEPADQAKVMTIGFDYSVFSGTYVDGDLSVWIYDVTNAVLIQPAPSTILNTGVAAKWQATFQTSSNSTSYRLIWHISSVSASAYSLYFDNISVGPQAIQYGAPVTDMGSISWTPIWGKNAGTQPALGNGTLVGKAGRIGDKVEAKITLTAGTTSTFGDSSGTFTFSLPPGHTIDTSKELASSATDDTLLGHFRVLRSGITRYSGVVIYNTSTSVKLMRYAVNATSTSTMQMVETNYAANGVDPFNPAGAGDIYVLDFSYHPVGWSSSVQMSSDADTRVVSAYVGKTADQSIATATFTKVTFGTVVEDSHGSWDAVNNRYVVKVPGKYEVNATLVLGSNNTGYRTVMLYKNGVRFQDIAAIDNPSATNASVPSGKSAPFSCVAGDYLEIWIYQNSGGNLNVVGPGVGSTFMGVKMLQGPSQIAASETVAALYRGQPTGTLNGSFNIATFPTKVKDSHSAYSSGSYTIPSSGTYAISSAVDIAATFTLGNFSFISIFIDGVETYSNFVVAGGAVGEVQPVVSVTNVPLLAGQIITIRTKTAGSSTSYGSNAAANYFSITRTGSY